MVISKTQGHWNKSSCLLFKSSPMLDEKALGLELILIFWQSTHKWLSHKPGGRLPSLPARPAVTFPAEEHH